MMLYKSYSIPCQEKYIIFQTKIYGDQQKAVKDPTTRQIYILIILAIFNLNLSLQ